MSLTKRGEVEYYKQQARVYADIAHDLGKNVERLTLTNAELSTTILLQEKRLDELTNKCKELAEHIKRMNETPTQFSSGPLWMSEEEEDARDAYSRGDIDRGMLEEKLLELGLDPNISTE